MTEASSAVLVSSRTMWISLFTTVMSLDASCGVRSGCQTLDTTKRHVLFASSSAGYAVPVEVRIFTTSSIGIPRKSIGKTVVSFLESSTSVVESLFRTSVALICSICAPFHAFYRVDHHFAGDRL